MVVDVFPSFRDELWLDGRRVMFWKRAQILVAETWAAFYPTPVPFLPPSNSQSSSAASPPSISPIEIETGTTTTTATAPHPFFPSGIAQLTMFADYRVPQILHHLSILTYPPSLIHILESHTNVAPGSREEMSVRAASILAVEEIKGEIKRIRRGEGGDDSEVEAEAEAEAETISSVLIDFYLWDLAKRIESGDDAIEGVQTTQMVPAHRTRSIWY